MLCHQAAVYVDLGLMGHGIKPQHAPLPLKAGRHHKMPPVIDPAIMSSVGRIFHLVIIGSRHRDLLHRGESAAMLPRFSLIAQLEVPYPGQLPHRTDLICSWI